MSAAARPLGLICAIPEEIAHFGDSFEETACETAAGLTFRSGLLEDAPVVLVESGIGKVNAALVSTLLCDRFACHALLFSGVAGGLDPDLGIGDVVIGTRLIQHDYGALIEERIRCYQPGIPPLPGFPQDIGFTLPDALRARVEEALSEVELPRMPAAATGDAPREPVIRYGTILTGDTFLNCEATRVRLAETFQAQAVEMEGAAVAQVAERFGVPCLVVRCLSDLAGADSHADFPSFVHAAAASSAVLIRRLVRVV